jgi:hypothetical protein
MQHAKWLVPLPDLGTRESYFSREDGRNDDQQLPPLLCPFFGKKNPGLNRFPKSNFVGEDRAFRERRAEREQRGVDLVRVQVDLGVVCQ